ncbi:MAG: hypothetical protein NZ937_08785 [Armatimonadetes bacterium]|nr:hypothetical protein [Armatimonadota bacterium]
MCLGVGYAILAGGLVILGGFVIEATGGIGMVAVGAIAGAVAGATYYGYSTPYEEWDNFALAERIVAGGLISAGLTAIGVSIPKLPKLAVMAIDALEEYGRYLPPLL